MLVLPSREWHQPRRHGVCLCWLPKRSLGCYPLPRFRIYNTLRHEQVQKMKLFSLRNINTPITAGCLSLSPSFPLDFRQPPRSFTSSFIFFYFALAWLATPAWCFYTSESNNKTTLPQRHNSTNCIIFERDDLLHEMRPPIHSPERLVSTPT